MLFSRKRKHTKTFSPTIEIEGNLYKLDNANFYHESDGWYFGSERMLTRNELEKIANAWPKPVDVPTEAKVFVIFTDYNGFSENNFCFYWEWYEPVTVKVKFPSQ